MPDLPTTLALCQCRNEEPTEPTACRTMTPFWMIFFITCARPSAPWEPHHTLSAVVVTAPARQLESAPSWEQLRQRGSPRQAPEYTWGRRPPEVRPSSPQCIRTAVPASASMRTSATRNATPNTHKNTANYAKHTTDDPHPRSSAGEMLIVALLVMSRPRTLKAVSTGSPLL